VKFTFAGIGTDDFFTEFVGIDMIHVMILSVFYAASTMVATRWSNAAAGSSHLPV
jgi:hypothetical protein